MHVSTYHATSCIVHHGVKIARSSVSGPLTDTTQAERSPLETGIEFLSIIQITLFGQLTKHKMALSFSVTITVCGDRAHH